MEALRRSPSRSASDGGEERSDADESSSGSESGSESSDEDREDSGSSADESESEAPELAVDQHGRVVAQIPSSCYRFRSFSGVFAEDMAPSLRADCCKAARSVRGVHSASEYSEGQTFWIGADDTPRCSLERLAQDVFRLHTGVEGCAFDAGCSGAEWWCLAMDAESSQVAWHWDKDYSLEQSGINISPHLATVTYLSDEGAPTVMMDKTCSTDYSADISGDAHTVFLSRPAFGKHVVFDGRFLHAAPGELSLWADSSDHQSQSQRSASAREEGASAAAIAAQPAQPAQRVSFLVTYGSTGKSWLDLHRTRWPQSYSSGWTRHWRSFDCMNHNCLALVADPASDLVHVLQEATRCCAVPRQDSEHTRSDGQLQQ